MAKYKIRYFAYIENSPENLRLLDRNIMLLTKAEAHLFEKVSTIDISLFVVNQEKLLGRIHCRGCYQDINTLIFQELQEKQQVYDYYIEIQWLNKLKNTNKSKLNEEFAFLFQQKQRFSKIQQFAGHKLKDIIDSPQDLKRNFTFKKQQYFFQSDTDSDSSQSGSSSSNSDSSSNQSSDSSSNSDSSDSSDSESDSQSSQDSRQRRKRKKSKHKSNRRSEKQKKNRKNSRDKKKGKKIQKQVKKKRVKSRQKKSKRDKNDKHRNHKKREKDRQRSRNKRKQDCSSQTIFIISTYSNQNLSQQSQ